MREIGLGERVVKDLTRDIWGNNHYVYCDNYFTSVKLFEDLLANGTYVCGTIRTNRWCIPHAVSKSNLRTQESVSSVKKTTWLQLHGGTERLLHFFQLIQIH